MWVVEELRRDRWVRISGHLPEPEAAAVAHALRRERPWRTYRAVPA